MGINSKIEKKINKFCQNNVLMTISLNCNQYIVLLKVNMYIYSIESKDKLFP